MTARLIEQIDRSPKLDDAARVDAEDLVEADYRVQPVRDRDDRRRSESGSDDMLHLGVGRRVDVRAGSITSDDL